MVLVAFRRETLNRAFKPFDYLDAEGQKYIDTIMGVAKQPYTPATPFPFTYGEVVGAIGLQSADAPLHIPGVRMMAPNPSLPRPKFGPYDPLCNYTPFKVVDICGRPAAALNLANSLPTTTPGSPFYGNKLGNLRLCCFNADGGDGSISKENATPIGGNIDYAAVEIFFSRARAWWISRSMPTPWTSRSASRGLTTTGRSRSVRLSHATRRRFGRAKRRPQSAITIVNREATTDSHGRACFTIQVSDSGNSRDYVDGQIDYLKYRLKSAADGYIQALDDLVSIQVYQNYPLSRLIKNNHPGNPLITWDSGVRDILAQ